MPTPPPATTDWVPIWGVGGPPAAQPSVRVYRSTAQAIASTGLVVVSFDTVRVDKGGAAQWSAGQPTRLTCQTAGTYLVWTSMQFVPGAGGVVRQVLIRKNGSILVGTGGTLGPTITGAGYPVASVAVTLELQVGDYVEVVLQQDSSGNLNTNNSDAGTSQHASEFGMAMVGGPQGPAGIGVPTPVVNGSTIVGSGGAAIWSPVVADTAWHDIGAAGEPGYGSGFRGYEAGGDTAYNVCGFRKTSAGIVVMKGMAFTVSGGAGTVFTIPAGFRPIKTVLGASFTAANGMVRVDVGSNGTVVLQAALAGNSWFSLELLRWYAEQ